MTRKTETRLCFSGFKISDSLDNGLYSVAWLRLDQISARNFDKSARRFLLVKNLCSFILTTKPEKHRLISVFPIIKKEPGTNPDSYPTYNYLLLGLLLKDLI